MKKLLFLLFTSILVLSACGNEEKKEEPKKETKSTEKKVNKDKENKKVKDKENQEKQPQQQSDKQPKSQEQAVEQSQQMRQQTQNYTFRQEPSNDKNTVTEYYNGQSHTTTNNPVRDNYVPGETDPIYEREYKHFYTPEEAQRAQENSDAALREMGIEPETYE
ncbi:hypothetical protein O0D34_00350 [Staphylococcus pseudintermedius]|nr:hypothetical protein [Staphylococcus pseudintermedius]